MALQSWLTESVSLPPAMRRALPVSRVVPIAFLLAVLFLVAVQYSGLSYSPLMIITGSEPDAPAQNDKTRPEGFKLKNWPPPTPEEDVEIQGIKASVGLNPKLEYPLTPFSAIPMDTSPHKQDDKDNPWLGAVISTASDINRRMLIRYSWMARAHDIPMDQRFVIANPGPRLTETIQRENQTFGDMIVLDSIHEDKFTANTIKTIELFRWLAEKSPRKYAFVSKVDSDIYLNARAMWETKLLPRLRETKSIFQPYHTYEAVVQDTLIGQWAYGAPDYGLVYAHGAMYTVTWDLVELLPGLQDQYKIVIGEDLLIPWLLLEAKHVINFVPLNSTEKFDFTPKDTRLGEKTAWADKGTDSTSLWHALSSKDAIAIHQLKTDEWYLAVADCFDEQGVKDIPENTAKPREGKDKPGYPRPWVDRIPEDHWEVDWDGRIVVNGVWKLEEGVGRDLKYHNTST